MEIEVSLIIPTHNRKDSLRKTLQSVSAQSFPKDKFEVIVIDDGSQVELDEVIKEFSAKNLNIQKLVQKRRGPAAARNLGIKNSRGRIVAFTDDDCMLSEKWLKVIYSAHCKNPDLAVIGGRTWVKRENSLKGMLAQLLSNSAMRAKLEGKKKIVFFPTSNLSLKRSVFQQVMFDEDIPYAGGEDLEFSWQLYLRGFKFLYLQEAEVLHLRENHFWEFLRQSYLYGKGNFLVQRKFPQHPALQEIATLPRTFSSILMLPLFSFYISRKISKQNDLRSRDKFLLFFYLLLYRISYFGGYLSERFKEFLKRKTFLCSPN